MLGDLHQCFQVIYELILACCPARVKSVVKMLLWWDLLHPTLTSTNWSWGSDLIASWTYLADDCFCHTLSIIPLALGASFCYFYDQDGPPLCVAALPPYLYGDSGKQANWSLIVIWRMSILHRPIPKPWLRHEFFKWQCSSEVSPSAPATGFGMLLISPRRSCLALLKGLFHVMQFQSNPLCPPFLQWKETSDQIKPLQQLPNATLPAWCSVVLA